MTRPPIKILRSGLLIFSLTMLLFCNRLDREAEVFGYLDISLQEVRRQMETLNLRFLNKIKTEAELNQDQFTRRYLDYALQLELHTKDFCVFIDSIKTLLEPDTDTSAGSLFSRSPGAVLTVSAPGGSSPASRVGLKARALWNLLDSLSDGDPLFKAGIPLKYEYFENGRYQSNGYQSSFLALPYSGILAVLSDLQNQALATGFMGLRYCLSKVSYSRCYPDPFLPAVSAKASYVLPGEQYEADIFLSAYHPEVLAWEVKINGNTVRSEEGIVHYEVNTKTYGEHKYYIESIVKQKRRTEDGVRIDTFRSNQTFTYEVGCAQPKVQIKPRFLYAGVDNPITILPRCGLAPNFVDLTATHATIQRVGGGQYLVKPSKAGKVRLKVDIRMGLPPSVYEYEVRPLPAPEPALGNELRSGRIRPEEIARQTALTLIYPDDFDFDVNSVVESFQLTRIRPREDAAEVRNKGGEFNKGIKQLLTTARPDDRLLFHDIIVRIPGDSAPRNIGALVFQVD